MLTEIKMCFNMGYLHGEEERRFELTDRVTDFDGFWYHLSELMPSPKDFDQSISGITLHTLNTDPYIEDTMTYGMQIGFTIHHEAPLSVEATRCIIDAVYENGANASYTPDSDDTYPHTFIGPYQFTEAEPNPKTEEPKSMQYNCSPAFASCDGEYIQAVAVDMHYTCERCGRTISHSIDNPTVCKRCF